jgi:hypothetical protein
MGRLNIMKMSILPILINRFNTIHVKTPAIFHGYKQDCSKICIKMKRYYIEELKHFGNIKTKWEERNRCRRLRGTNF